MTSGYWVHRLKYIWDISKYIFAAAFFHFLNFGVVGRQNKTFEYKVKMGETCDGQSFFLLFS